MRSTYTSSSVIALRRDTSPSNPRPSASSQSTYVYGQACLGVARLPIYRGWWQLVNQLCERPQRTCASPLYPRTLVDLFTVTHPFSWPPRKQEHRYNRLIHTHQKPSFSMKYRNRWAPFDLISITCWRL